MSLYLCKPETCDGTGDDPRCPHCAAARARDGLPPLPTPPTATAREAEARRELDQTMERYADMENPSREYPHNQRSYDADVQDNQRMLNEYAASIRATEREAAVRMLEALRATECADDCASHHEIGDSREHYDCTCKRRPEDGWNSALDAAVSAITNATEGTDHG